MSSGDIIEGLLCHIGAPKFIFKDKMRILREKSYLKVIA